jgi:hypothetical protein
MSVARTARRRRKQAANNFRHLAKLGRPIYPGRISAETSAKREANFRLNLKKLQSRKKKR